MPDQASSTQLAPDVGASAGGNPAQAETLPTAEAAVRAGIQPGGDFFTRDVKIGDTDVGDGPLSDKVGETGDQPNDAATTAHMLTENETETSTGDGDATDEVTETSEDDDTDEGDEVTGDLPEVVEPEPDGAGSSDGSTQASVD